jgi:hypothetical protein
MDQTEVTESAVVVSMEPNPTSQSLRVDTSVDLVPTSLNFSIDTSPSSKDESKSMGSCSRYGRARAVPNFAKMIDPLSTRGTAQTSEATRSLGGPGSDEMPAKSFSSLVERVHDLVSKIGVTVLAPLPESPGTPQPGSEKYIGVRSKHVGVDRRFSAVIKKNHSEIHLGIYQTAAEVRRL